MEEEIPKGEKKKFLFMDSGFLLILEYRLNAN
jgi:hypothetical protein